MISQNILSLFIFIGSQNALRVTGLYKSEMVVFVKQHMYVYFNLCLSRPNVIVAVQATEKLIEGKFISVTLTDLKSVL